MGLPIQSNSTQEGCSPISSNCVIWQGPDIPCINLCNGDSVSDVVAKLASKLCIIIDQLDITAYDLSCFNPVCPNPQDFQNLIQFILDKVCELEGISQEKALSPNCPDNCIVTIATCFQEPDFLGNIVTTLSLKDYVIKIGNEVCSILTQITTINNSINQLDARVTLIEDTCCNGTVLPTIPTSCLSGSTDIPLVTFVTDLETAFCELQDALGDPTAQNTAVNTQCVANTDEQLSNPPAQMSAISGWVLSPATVSDTITNMWLTICDIRTAVATLQTELAACCSTPGCADVVLTMTALYSKPDIILSFGASTFPSGYDFCANSTVTITGSNGQTYIDTAYALDLPSPGTAIDLTGQPVAISLYYIVNVAACYTNGISTCTQTFNYGPIRGELGCPTITAGSWTSPDSSHVQYSFSTAVVTPTTYQVTLTNVTLGTSEVHNYTVSAPGTISSPNTSITAAAGQSFEIDILITQGVYSLSCPASYTYLKP